MNGEPNGRRGRIVGILLIGAGVFLAAESWVPPDRQISARACLAAVRAYQTSGSPLLRSCGVRCRYTPSCSQYAADAIARYGTIEGAIRTLGRLCRCSPWGGSGYDPAVEPPCPGPQETPEEIRQREAEERLRKAQEEAQEEINRALKQTGRAAGTCLGGCVVSLLAGLVLFLANLLAMIWIYKDGKARNESNALLWMILEFFFPPVGLIVYLAVRPKGDLSPCGNCHNRRLSTLTKCPHCGQETGSAGSPPSI